MALGTRDPETPAPAMVTGSDLVTINRWQAHAYEQAVTVAYRPDQPPPVGGWNPAGEHGAPVGYDLVLATPRTLSALGWCFFSTDRGVSDEIMRADHRAVQDVAVEFSVTPQREREVWAPLDAVTVVGMAERLIFGYHLLLRRSVSATLRELGLNWQQMAQDGTCEVWGLTAPMLACLGRPARRLGEIHACQVE